MTANAMKTELDACLAAGMNDHVTKPIDRKALVATLRRWLPRRPADPTSALTFLRPAMNLGHRRDRLRTRRPRLTPSPGSRASM